MANTQHSFQPCPVPSNARLPRPPSAITVLVHSTEGHTLTMHRCLGREMVWNLARSGAWPMHAWTILHCIIMMCCVGLHGNFPSDRQKQKLLMFEGKCCWALLQNCGCVFCLAGTLIAEKPTESLEVLKYHLMFAGSSAWES